MLKIKHLEASIKLHVKLQVNISHVTSFLKYTLLCYLIHYCVLSLPS